MLFSVNIQHFNIQYLVRQFTNVLILCMKTR